MGLGLEGWGGAVGIVRGLILRGRGWACGPRGRLLRCLLLSILHSGFCLRSVGWFSVSRNAGEGDEERKRTVSDISDLGNTWRTSRKLAAARNFLAVDLEISQVHRYLR